MDNKRQSKHSNLNRLKQLAAGKISLQEIKPAGVFIVVDRNDKPGIYTLETLNGNKDMNERQYFDFCKKVEARNNGSLIFRESRQYEQNKR